MVDGAKEYNEWTQRVMADVGDLVDWIAEGSGQSPEDVLREVHGYAAAAVKDFGHDVAPAPAPKKQPELSPSTQILERYANQEDGTEAVIAKTPAGYSVVLRDTDADETLPVAHIFPTLEQARAKAKEMAGPGAVQASTPPEQTGPGVSNASPESKAPGLSTKPTGAIGLVNAVYNKLKAGESLGNITELNKLAEEHFGASRTSGQWSPKDAFDAMEAGINKYLLERGKELMAMDPIKGLAELRKVMDRITSQASVRTEDQLTSMPKVRTEGARDRG
jgi:hypothetical protein